MVIGVEFVVVFVYIVVSVVCVLWLFEVVVDGLVEGLSFSEIVCEFGVSCSMVYGIVCIFVDIGYLCDVEFGLWYLLGMVLVWMGDVVW